MSTHVHRGVRYEVKDHTFEQYRSFIDAATMKRTDLVELIEEDDVTSLYFKTAFGTFFALSRWRDFDRTYESRDQQKVRDWILVDEEPPTSYDNKPAELAIADPIPGAPMYWHDAATDLPPIDDEPGANKMYKRSKECVLVLKEFPLCFFLGHYYPETQKWQVNGSRWYKSTVTHYLILKQPT